MHTFLSALASSTGLLSRQVKYIYNHLYNRFPRHSSLKNPSSYDANFLLYRAAAQTTALTMPHPASSGIGTALTSPLGRTKLKQQSQDLNSLGRIKLNLQPGCTAVVPEGIPICQFLHELDSLRREAATPEYS